MHNGSVRSTGETSHREKYPEEAILRLAGQASIDCIVQGSQAETILEDSTAGIEVRG